MLKVKTSKHTYMVRRGASTFLDMLSLKVGNVLSFADSENDDLERALMFVSGKIKLDIFEQMKAARVLGIIDNEMKWKAIDNFDGFTDRNDISIMRIEITNAINAGPLPINKFKILSKKINPEFLVSDGSNTISNDPNRCVELDLVSHKFNANSLAKTLPLMKNLETCIVNNYIELPITIKNLKFVGPVLSGFKFPLLLKHVSFSCREIANFSDITLDFPRTLISMDISDITFDISKIVPKTVKRLSLRGNIEKVRPISHIDELVLNCDKGLLLPGWRPSIVAAYGSVENLLESVDPERVVNLTCDCMESVGKCTNLQKLCITQHSAKVPSFSLEKATKLTDLTVVSTDVMGNPRHFSHIFRSIPYNQIRKLKLSNFSLLSYDENWSARNDDFGDVFPEEISLDNCENFLLSMMFTNVQKLRIEFSMSTAFEPYNWFCPPTVSDLELLNCPIPINIEELSKLHALKGKEVYSYKPNFGDKQVVDCSELSDLEILICEKKCKSTLQFVNVIVDTITKV